MLNTAQLEHGETGGMGSASAAAALETAVTATKVELLEIGIGAYISLLANGVQERAGEAVEVLKATAVMVSRCVLLLVGFRLFPVCRSAWMKYAVSVRRLQLCTALTTCAMLRSHVACKEFVCDTINSIKCNTPHNLGTHIPAVPRQQNGLAAKPSLHRAEFRRLHWSESVDTPPTALLAPRRQIPPCRRLSSTQEWQWVNVNPVTMANET